MKKLEQLKQKNVTGWDRESHRACSVLEVLLGINHSVNKSIFRIPNLLWERVVLVTELHVCACVQLLAIGPTTAAELAKSSTSGWHCCET